MVYNSLYDIGADPGIMSRTLYDFGYHSDEILLNEFGNKSTYEMGYAVGQTTMGAEIAAATARLSSKTRWTYETKIRKELGVDKATSQQIIEYLDGKTNSITHQVTRDGTILHQHQKHVGKYRTIRQFPDEWVQYKTIGE